ncbi:hypothetical protein QE152_g13286 [Popillia japonica]|uniref:Uncharacterized protein n=1 Tax=Popillia japonica TaxID=7064 RepID=A0AAW1LEJ6_POPJA
MGYKSPRASIPTKYNRIYLKTKPRLNKEDNDKNSPMQARSEMKLYPIQDSITVEDVVAPKADNSPNKITEADSTLYKELPKRQERVIRLPSKFKEI